MHKDLEGIWVHMRDLGLCALSHASAHSSLMSFENHRWAELAVLQAAHAAELLIKARIAQENPLLIFSKIPDSQEPYQLLDFQTLFTNGQTIQWNELPARLWAVTGMSLNRAAFGDFGRFRNAIQHFAPPADESAQDKTLDFIFTVIDPLIHQAWGLCAIDFNEDYDPYPHYVALVIKRGLHFHISNESAKCFDTWDVDWEGVSAATRTHIEGEVRRQLTSDQ